MKEIYKIDGMSCSACSNSIERSLNRIKEIKTANVNLMTAELFVEYDGSDEIRSKIISSVTRLGFGITIKPEIKDENEEKDKGKTRLILSIIFLVFLMYISMGSMIGLPAPKIFTHHSPLSFALSQLVFLIPILILNRRYFINGFKNLFKGHPNMDTLIAIGSSSAVVYGLYVTAQIISAVMGNQSEMAHSLAMDLYFESAGTILTLISLGKFLESRSKKRTTDAIKKLYDLSPKTATVLRDGKEVVLSPEEIKVGDTVIVKAGEKIAADGTVISGSGSVDTSAITGESMPMDVSVNCGVTGGTILESGYIEIRVEKVLKDSTLFEIIRLIEAAGSNKSKSQRLADKISGVFVPTVISIALITFVVWILSSASLHNSISHAIAVLVISCPCALGLATPVAIMTATGRGAKSGILIKSPDALENMGKIGTVVLDKTGTVTLGKPKVYDVINLSNGADFESVAFSLEQKSDHPIAKTITEYFSGKSALQKDVAEFENIEGQGVCGKIDEKIYFAGNARMLKVHNLYDGEVKEKFDALAESGRTAIAVFCEGEVLGIISVADEIKESSAKAVLRLKEMGIKTVMLTGDNNQVAAAVAKEVGIDEFRAELLPQDKERIVREIKDQGSMVAMVGDGINDAPSLTSADVGIAIGAGTDIAIDSADIVLCKNDLQDVCNSVTLGRATLRNIKQNLFWAFFYNALGIPIAAGVFSGLGINLDPMFAAAAMSLSSIFVVTNALRLKVLKFKGE